MMHSWLGAILLGLCVLSWSAPAAAQAPEAGARAGHRADDQPANDRLRVRPVPLQSAGGEGPFLLGGIIVLVVLGMMAQAGRHRRFGHLTHPVDVTALRLAISWDERVTVQRELERIARTVDPSTPYGLARLLRESANALRRGWHGWLAAAIANQSPSRLESAEAMSQQILRDAHIKFHREVLMSRSSLAASASPDQLRAVVVTLVVVARGELRDFPGTASYEQVRLWLEAMSNFGSSELISVEVTWSPASVDHELTGTELASLYPELAPLRRAM